MRSLLFIAAAFTLASCADKGLPTDTVRDPEAAIAIAKKSPECRFSSDPSRRWTAWLHDGVWDVRQYYPGNSGECGWNGTKVRALDGYTDGQCEGCTITE